MDDRIGLVDMPVSRQGGSVLHQERDVNTVYRHAPRSHGYSKGRMDTGRAWRDGQGMLIIRRGQACT